MARQAQKLINDCPKCKGKNFFHIGDKVSFGGNKTYFSHSELRYVAEHAGLLFTGKQKRVRVVILSPNGASRRHHSEAKKFSDRVMTPDEFRLYVSKVCRGRLPKIPKKVPLKNHLKPGARIFCMIPEKQVDIVSKYVSQYGARVSNRKTKNLSAVIASKKYLSPGQSDFFRFLGVPVYYFERLQIRN